MSPRWNPGHWYEWGTCCFPSGCVGCGCCCGIKENCCSEVTVPSGNLDIWKSYGKVGIFPKVLEVELMSELWILLLLLQLRLTLLSLRKKLLCRELLMGLLTVRVSELRRVEECVDDINEWLEEGSHK